jgi:hypothetical protein
VNDTPSQALLAQSVSAWQCRVRPQAAQVPPPQSTSVSLPSFLWSLHWFVTQVSELASQALLEQSVSTPQCSPVAQVAQVPPPQSTSVSTPSCLWSVHVLLAHLPVTKSHALLVQSVLARHHLPVAQARPVPPPQSTSVSAPSFLWSTHRLATHFNVTRSQALLAQAALLPQGPPTGWPTQTLAVQSPLMHTLPHAPQLPGSVLVLVSQPSEALPLQSLKPELQEKMLQAPATQAAEPLLTMQTFPQAPQLLGSVCSFTQEAPHSTCPAGQEAEQTPRLQVVPVLQTVPHAPQLLLSVCSFTHVPLQFVCPEPHEDPLQVPPTQGWPQQTSSSSSTEVARTTRRFPIPHPACS